MKYLDIVAGPNGSGKSTFAETFYLHDKTQSPVFINSDVIASGISPLNVEAAAFHAGRIMLETIKSNVAHAISFSFETTLSGKTWATILSDAKSRGYQITIYFIYLDRVQENLKRIRQRKKNGGHDVPTETVKRRYPKSIENFWELYRNKADNWFIFDNSGKKPKLVHSRESYERLSTEKQNKFEKVFLSHSRGST